jgi:hypothetical protein
MKLAVALLVLAVILVVGAVLVIGAALAGVGPR